MYPIHLSQFIVAPPFSECAVFFLLSVVGSCSSCSQKYTPTPCHLAGSYSFQSLSEPLSPGLDGLGRFAWAPLGPVHTLVIKCIAVCSQVYPLEFFTVPSGAKYPAFGGWLKCFLENISPVNNWRVTSSLSSSAEQGYYVLLFAWGVLQHCELFSRLLWLYLCDLCRMWSHEWAKSYWNGKNGRSATPSWCFITLLSLVATTAIYLSYWFEEQITVCLPFNKAVPVSAWPWGDMNWPRRVLKTSCAPL